LSTLPSSERHLADDGESVLVLFANRENRALMSDMLRAAGYGVSSVFPPVSGRPADVRDFDLCIVDGPSLNEYWDRLLAVQAQQQPVPLPVLFFSDRRDVGLTTRNLWHVVDDVVERPVDKLTLRARIETLIRSRRLALQVRRLAGLYEHERHIAQRFQEAALPRALPQIPGLNFSAFYSPATNEAYVGGDWYDAASLPDGRVILSIGDVCGFGLDAAVAMANVRQVVRGVAQIHPDPAVMLDAADRTLHDADNERIVTAFVGIFDPVTSLLTYASAGHPRPLLRCADGSVTELSAFGLPLGLPMRTEPRTSESVSLPEGSLLVLFTDGLTEATHDLLAGEQRLRAIIASGAIMDAPNIAQAIGSAVLPLHSNDDVAILTVATAARGASGDVPLRWSFDADDATAARAARFEYAADLTRHGISPCDLISAELIFAELLGNVVRYAPGSTEIALTWASSAPVLHVLDSGPGFRHFPKLPIDLLNESGRGLFIVSSLAQEFAVDARPSGGSHARAILPFHIRERRRDRETST
jgi:serine phosphatase RsbU (regulator of sigma subunit)/anti-sigma regulatory factor (Ser/Thr protein kinase)